MAITEALRPIQTVMISNSQCVECVEDGASKRYVSVVYTESRSYELQLEPLWNEYQGVYRVTERLGVWHVPVSSNLLVSGRYLSLEEFGFWNLSAPGSFQSLRAPDSGELLDSKSLQPGTRPLTVPGSR
ncbi:hypothetical protein J6590_070069 [Homalodisca vitripennis]|nr:hypothetical protein J6590_070069 [Homalodisca vitripennis]